MNAQESKTTLLYFAADHVVRDRGATPQFALQKAIEFASGFPGTITDPGWVLYQHRFGQLFRAGMPHSPESVLKWVNDLLPGAMQRFRDAGGAMLLDEQAREREAVVAAERNRRQVAARERREREQQAAAAAKAERDRKDKQVIDERPVEALAIGDLSIPAKVKAAYKSEGLEFVGDLLAYKQVKPLASIKGVTEESAASTVSAIDALRSERAESNQSSSDRPKSLGTQAFNG